MMFENFVTNIKTGSARITESLSVENLKSKTTKLSETLDNLKTTVINKTNSLSSYLSEAVDIRDGPTKTISTPNLNGAYVRSRISDHNLMWPVLVENQMRWVNYQPSYDDDEDSVIEPDIIDKFVRVVNMGDELFDQANRNVSHLFKKLFSKARLFFY